MYTATNILPSSPLPPYSMAFPSATLTTTKTLLHKLLFHSSLLQPPPNLRRHLASATTIASSLTTNETKTKNKNKEKRKTKSSHLEPSQLKRRTRSDKELDEESFRKQYGNDNSAHVPVMLAEVLDVFAPMKLYSFVDCTLGAAGHSSAMIEAHPEMNIYVGLDVDPTALEMAQARINDIFQRDSIGPTSNLRVHTFLKNFRNIKSVLHDVDDKLLARGVDGILMDLGMSSMQVNNAERGFSVLSNGPLDMRMNPQASLTAEDILNSWPEAEVGKILRDYGEESNWYHLQKKIVKTRISGGLHSTSELVDVIRSSTSGARGGRQGWIKTAIRVFQALRIAVNDELNTLEDSIHACFSSLASGGRLAVISFHSLEDRIVKQTFLNIVNSNGGEGEDCTQNKKEGRDVGYDEKEAWIKQIVRGYNGTILTKRPITPSETEEKLNIRSRSAKLRVIQKA